MILASSTTQREQHLSSTFDGVLPSPHVDQHTDQSSSDGEMDHCPIHTDKEKIGIAQAVRIFGGVIIGAAAEKIARSWDPVSIPLSAQDYDVDSAHEGYRSNPVLASFGVPPPSPRHPSDDSSEVSSGDLESADFERGEASRGSFLPERPGEPKKRKISDKSTGGESASFVSECDLPTDMGLFRLRSYRFVTGRKTHEPVVMIVGDIRGGSSVPVRVHDQCQTSEVFGSKRCDCREQLDTGLRYMQKNGGAVIYLAQEGRGIGLANKVAAYALQDGGADTVDANRRLGFKDDERSYECVKYILEDMAIKSIRLMTNNPFKIQSLKALGIKVEGRIPIQIAANKHNYAYLDAKVARMGHLINNL